MKKISSHIYILAILAILFALPTISSAATIGKSASNSGLVGYWSFNEGTGTTAGDASGGGNKGTLTNGPIWTSGKLGKALSFDGSNDSVVVSNTASLQTSAAMTISTWVYLPAYASNINPRIIEKYDDADNGYAMSIGGANNTGRVSFIFKKAGVTYEALVASAALPLNTWVHVSGVFTGSAVNIYINGISQSLSGSAFVIQDTSGNLLIKVGSAGSPAVSGKLDEVRIYNRALTAAEVMALYKAGGTTQKVANKNGLIGQWKFDEGMGVTTGDSSGNGGYGLLYPNLSGVNTSTSTMWTAGKLGKGVLLDGTDDYVPTSRPNILGGLTAASVGAWFKTTSSAAYDTILGEANNDGNFAITINMTGAGAGKLSVYNYRTSAGWNYYSSTVALNDGKWHHVFATWASGGSLILYIDGLMASTTPATVGAFKTGQQYIFNIGMMAGSGQALNGVFEGSIDDVRAYSRALTAAEVLSIYKENATAANVSQATKLTSGLVGYWSFNGADVTDKVYDRVGGNHGYITGVATSSAKTIGKVGQGLTFDGVNDYVTITSPGIDLSSSTGYTESVWVYSQVSDTNYHAIMGFGTALGNRYPTIYVSNQNNIEVYFGYGATQCGGFFTSVLTHNTWNHIVVTFNGTLFTLYINGVSAGTGSDCSGKVPASQTTVRLGASDNFFPGKLDEVRIYNRALSAAEAKQLYLLGR